MKEIKATCTKGTRILLGNEKRDLIDSCIGVARTLGFTEIQIPILQEQEIFSGKIGEENNHMMYTFKDKGDRDLCLAPEYTAVVQKLALEHDFKYQKDVKLFYVQECFRGEKPQAGRYRQFTQFGMEILNPTKDYLDFLIEICEDIVGWLTKNSETIIDTKRGLDYYIEGKGFEIKCPKLGAQQQVCGGGAYKGGIGFAIGIDRLLLLNN